MEIDIRADGADTTIIELSGDLAGELPAQARAHIQKRGGVGQRFLLDLTRLAPLSKAGLCTLLALLRRIKAAGGAILARNIPEAVVTLADAAGFVVLSRESALGKGQPFHDVVFPCIDIHPAHYHTGLGLRPGSPVPFGASLVDRGINFAIYSRYAESCTLLLYQPALDASGEHREPFAEIPFPAAFRVGDVFAMTVIGLEPDAIEYGFRVEGPFAPKKGHRFDPTKVLLDPAARAVSGLAEWGARSSRSGETLLLGGLVPDDFDWEGDRSLRLPTEDLVIYEMHLRGFTRSPSSGVRFPGTYAGLREKIPYLRELGVNCVELMPIFEFDECENKRHNPLTGERLVNYWGYSTLGFYAPKAAYAATGPVGLQADEFKALVKELHQAGIEVILDVVFNHTAEGGENGPTISFRGLDNRTWYMLAPDGSYLDFGGCGNTLNCNHPVVRDFVRVCLRYWVAEYHIDGFRFDLASILGRDMHGTPLSNPPLLEAMAMDPVLAKTRLIAEAWDAAGLYQVGRFPAYGRWAEWNGKYRDCVRRFLKGDANQVEELAQRLMGSPDLYHDRGPWASVNFITCHDGFTLADLVSYNEKHNKSNGEDNRDGSNDNSSWNCGAEGPTDDPGILGLRRKQMKNALTILFVSQGIPMLLMGDEVGRTQQGNNNAYCHDSPLTWLDWTLQQHNGEMLRFCKHLIEFRKRHSALRQPLHPGTELAGLSFLEASWHGVAAWRPDWSPESRTLAFMLRSGREPESADVLYVALNMYWKPLTFALPAAPPGRPWRVFVNTAMATPEDVWAPGSEPALSDQRRFHVADRSVVVLVTRGQAGS